ncbi:MAG TPA: SDR family oxidoreductase [Terriglobales bacterium]|nr:SDR family oxidoreductase [Terriglobales bacterium]
MPALSGKVAIITGASSGIGAAVARNLAEAGVRLVLSARRRERLEALAGALPEVATLAGDIADPGLGPRLFALAQERWGGCDIVVNNAGELVVGTIEDLDLEAMAHMLEVNVTATFRMAYLAARRFKAQGSGHLVNTSSVLGSKVRLTAGAYSGSKHAIEALSEALRLELAGTRIKVTAIEPGLVMTELHEGLPVHPREQFGIRQALAPDDVARAVRFALEQPDHVLIAKLMVLAADQAL